MTIERLERILKEKPALANIPIVRVNGRVYTIREIVELYKVGRLDSRVLEKVRELGLDPNEEDIWELAKEYFKRISEKYPNIKIAILGVGTLSIREIVHLIEKRDPRVRSLVESYKDVLSYVRSGSLW